MAEKTSVETCPHCGTRNTNATKHICDKCKKSMTLKPHPASMLFPMMSKEEFVALKKDIEEHGLQDPVVVYEGKILDGRNRYQACRELRVACDFVSFDGSVLPLQYVVGKNLHRRQLRLGQRAALAAEAMDDFKAAAKRRQQKHGGTAPGKPKTLLENFPKVSGTARDHAARVFGVNGRYIQEAIAIRRELPELFKKLKSGVISISEATDKLKAKQAKEDNQGGVAPPKRTTKKKTSLTLTKETTPSDAAKLIKDMFGSEWLTQLAKAVDNLINDQDNLLSLTDKLKD